MASKNNDDEIDTYVPAADDELFYEQTIRQLRLEVNKGKTYDQACRVMTGVEKHLKKEIGEDFLRLMIAERHFGDGYGLDDIALFLDVSFEKIEQIRDFMLRDIGSSVFRDKRWPDNDFSH
jgi:hypothetical protein